MRRCSGLVLVWAAACAFAASTETLELAVGQVKLRSFVQTVRDVAVQSASSAIATAWYSPDRGVYVRGESPGTTDVVIRATKVGADGTPDESPTLERLRVEVSSQVREADDGRRVDGPTIVVKVGQTRSARFSRQTIGVRRHVSQPQLLGVSFENDALRLRGLRPGWSTLTISGEFVRFQAGINVPLQNNTPFSFQYNVHVVPEAETIRAAESVEIEVGGEYTVPLSRHSSGVSVSSSDGSTASAGVADRVLTIRGRSLGDATVTVKGKLASWPIQADGGTRRAEDPFEFTYRVAVRPPTYPGAEDVHREVTSELEAMREALRGLPDELAGFRDSLGEPEGASGVWKTASGAAVRVAQQGGRVRLINPGGLVFDGSDTGGRLRLAKRYVASREIPGSLPSQVKEQLVGSELVLEGALSPDGARFEATLVSEEVKFNAQTFEITSREPRRGTVAFDKEPDPPVPLPDLAAALSALQRDLARVEAEYAEVERGERSGAEFVDHALLEVYAGAVERMFGVRLQIAEVQVKMLARRHGQLVRDLRTWFDADAGGWAALTEPEKAAARAALESSYGPREQAAVDAILGEYRAAAAALAGAQQSLARALFAWENFSRAKGWAERADALYKRAFETLCYRLGQQPEFEGESVLDRFLASRDALEVPAWLLRTLRSPYQMDDAFAEVGLSRLHREALAENARPGEPADPEEREGLLTVTSSGTRPGDALQSLDLLVEDPAAPGSAPNNPNRPLGPTGPDNPATNPNAPVQTRSYSGAKPGEPPEPLP